MADTINISRHFGELMKDLPSLSVSHRFVEFQPLFNAYEGMSIRLDPTASGEDEDSSVVANTANAYVQLKANPENHPNFASMMQFANNLGVKISKAFEVLQYVVRPEVESMMEEIDKEVVETLRKENASFEEDAPLHNGFNTMDWDHAIQQVGSPDTVMEDIASLIGHQPSLFIGDLPYLVREADNFVDIPMHDEYKDEFIAKFGTNQANDDRGIRIFQMITDGDHTFRRFGRFLGSTMVEQNNFGSQACYLSEELGRIIPILEMVAHTPLNLPSEINTNIQNNVLAFRKLFSIGAYALMILRNSCKEQLVINSDTLNKDTLDPFIENGNEMEDILRFVYTKYVSKNKNPVGIPSEDVLHDKATTKAEFAMIQQSKSANILSIKRMANVSAMRKVCGDNLRNADMSRIPDNVDKEQFIFAHGKILDAISSRLEVSGDNNLENLVYDYVIDTWYPNTMVSTAHKMLGHQVVKMLSLSPEMSASDMAMVDLNVAAKMVADFLITNVFTVSYD